jgi:hypothetical protein
MKPRPPTAADHKALRRLYAAAGSRDALNLWIETALSEGKQSRGPKRYAEPSLIPLEILCLALERQGFKRTLLLRHLAGTGIQGRGIEQSTIDRLRRKLRDPKFQREFRQNVIVRKVTPKHWPQSLQRPPFPDLIRTQIKS